LHLYSKKEISQIVKMAHPDWSESVCDLVAVYAGRVPREALAFAEIMRRSHNRNPDSWEEVAKRCAENKGIDEFGMTYKRRRVLECLGEGPKSREGLCASLNIKDKELRKFVLPWLIESSSDQKALITVSNKHYITPAGLEELDKRGVDHIGLDALSASDRKKLELKVA
jgi:Holliday junction resolvasome RuvABC ATP-dependent DNA helicase subunit